MFFDNMVMVSLIYTEKKFRAKRTDCDQYNLYMYLIRCTWKGPCDFLLNYMVKLLRAYEG